MALATRKPCKGCGRNRAMRFYSGPRGRICSDCRRRKVRSYNRTTHLAETYGLTHEEYDALLAAQGDVCAICGGKRKYNLQVDHDHRTGAIRGLLCKQCNKRLLPACRDSAMVLLAAVEYLDNPPANEAFGVPRTVPTTG